MYQITKQQFTKFKKNFDSSEIVAFDTLLEALENLGSNDYRESAVYRNLLTAILETNCALSNLDDNSIYHNNINACYLELCNQLIKLLLDSQGIYTVYADRDDITFIMQGTKKDTTTEMRVIGFYHGEPNNHDTLIFANKWKAEYAL